MCSDGAGTVKSQHKWGQWQLTHIQKNYTQIDDDDGSGCDAVMVSLLSTGLVELLRHHHHRLICGLDFDNAPIITNDYHHCQYHGLVKTKFTKSNILSKKIAFFVMGSVLEKVSVDMKALAKLEI